jgi:AcrR family transcriptional regulator
MPRSRPLAAKDRIDRAALALFTAQGIAETSIRAIAHKAGVALGALYNHYESKEDLAWTLFATNFSRLGLELQRLAQAPGTIDARLRAMVAYVFGEFDRDRVLVGYVFLARHQALPKIKTASANPYLVFRNLIAEAIAQREVPAQDVDLATSLVVGAINQVVDTTALGRIKHDLAGHADRVASACVRLLGR